MQPQDYQSVSACDTLILRDFTFHSSRHTFGTLAISAGVGLHEVSRLLGHTSVRQTEKYVRFLDSARDAAVRRLPTLNDNPEAK